MKIEQKKHGTKIEYDFNDDFLYYKVNDEGGSGSANVQYEDITNNVTEYDERNQWYRNVGFAWLILGSIGTILNRNISIWLVLGVVFYGLYYYYRTSYSRINATSHNLLIIKDDKHDEVMKQIFDHRNEYLKAKYGKIDEKNNKQAELNKFTYLKNLGVIADYEFEDVKKALEGEVKKLPENK